MRSTCKILNAVKTAGFTILSIGITIFLFGFFVSDNSIATSIGIGTVMGAIFIFLIGVFFVATEEMEKRTDKGIQLKKECRIDTPFKPYALHIPDQN